MCFVPPRRALFPHLNFQKSSGTEVFCTFWLRNVLRAITACTFSTSQLPKVVRSWCVLHFDLKMCFAPQRHALFRHLKCQKWSAPLVFCTFWLRNVLRATTECTFSTSQLPKVLRAPGVLYILTWKLFRATTACNFSSLLSPTNSWSDSLHLQAMVSPGSQPPLNPPRWGHDFSKLAFSSKGIQQSSAIPIIFLADFRHSNCQSGKVMLPLKTVKVHHQNKWIYQGKSPNLNGELEPKWIYNLDG